MYNVGDVVVYKKDVCKIKEIKKNYFFDHDYYIMHPIDDDSLTINVPVECSSDMRYVISKEEGEKLIAVIPSIEVIETNENDIEYEYKKLLQEGSLENLVKVIKTTYLRDQERLSQNKKIGEKDDSYFQKVEKRLYQELSISFQMSFDDTKQYVIDSVSEQMVS